MPQYEHLPIYREAMRLAVHLENVVRGFARYHKYTLGSEMRSSVGRVTFINATMMAHKDGIQTH